MQKETRVALVIDKSTSMTPEEVKALWDHTINALRRVHGGRGGQVWVHKVVFSWGLDGGGKSSHLHKRDSITYTKAYDPIKLEQAREMHVHEAWSRQSATAIHDGMGLAWESLRDYDNRAGNVANLVIVCTDGNENDSRRYTLERIREVVQRTTRNGTFTWVYLTTDRDSPTDDEIPGIDPQNLHRHHDIPALVEQGIVKGLEGYFAAREAGYQAVETY